MPPAAPLVGMALRQWLRHVGSVLRPAEPVRFASQTAVAALSAYLVATAVGLDSRSWAVFSAVFVVEANLDGTLRTAAWRIAGGAVGIVIALFFIAVFGVGGWGSVAALGCSVALMSLLLGWKADLSFGLVTAAMLSVAPGFDVIGGAFDRSAAILLGIVAGTAAAALLFPRAAHWQARREVAAILDDCARLLRSYVRTMTTGDGQDAQPIRVSGDRHITQARQHVTEVQHGWLRRQRQKTPLPAAGAAERVWNTLTLLDRACFGRMPETIRESCGREVESIATAAIEAMGDIADALRSGRRPDPPEGMEEPLKALNAAVDRFNSSDYLARIDRREVERVESLCFAFEQIHDDLRALVKAAG